jgi:hypothetical protein
LKERSLDGQLLPIQIKEIIGHLSFWHLHHTHGPLFGSAAIAHQATLNALSNDKMINAK